MSAEDNINRKPRRVYDATISLLRELVEAGGPIYTLHSDQAARLMKLGVITRETPRGPYTLTPQANILLKEYSEKPARPPRVTPTSKFLAYIQSLSSSGVTRGDIVEQVNTDASRGISTSPRFIGQGGRRRPRYRGKT